jgi:hypothetical protein
MPTSSLVALRRPGCARGRLWRDSEPSSGVVDTVPTIEGSGYTSSIVVRLMFISLILGWLTVAIAMLMRRATSNLPRNPDEVADEFYGQFVDGYREVLRIRIDNPVDRMVLRSLLHSCGIPSAEWYRHFAGVRVGPPIEGYNTVEMLVLAEQSEDAFAVIGDFYRKRDPAEKPPRWTRLRVLAEFLVGGWIAVPSAVSFSPRVRSLPHVSADSRRR